jgi:LysR family transcriptional activator of nhaA
MNVTRREPTLVHPDLAALVATVETGTVSAAAKRLGISQPALSVRLSKLADATGGPLFARRGRTLVLTPHGTRVHDGALRVVRSCEALVAGLRGTTAGTPLRVGTADAVPKIVVRKILVPYLAAGYRVECREWRSDHLESELLSHRLDMLITDREPISLRGEDLASTVEGRSAIVFCARREIAARLRRGFPNSIADGRLALPCAPSPLRERLDRWLTRHAPSAVVAIEAEDRAMLHHFAQGGPYIVPVAKSTSLLVERQFGLVRIGEAKGVEESYFVVRSSWRVPETDPRHRAARPPQ